MNEKVQAIVEKIKEQQGKMTKLFEKELKSIVKSAGSLVDSITFEAYTPFFCDGEECTYSVRLDLGCLEINDKPFEEWEYQFVEKTVYNFSSVEEKMLAVAYLKVETIKDLPRGKIDILRSDLTPTVIEKYEKALVAITTFTEFLGEFDKEIIKLGFGDHVKVKVSKAGIELIEHRDHD
jgi:hypothetical protein